MQTSFQLVSSKKPASDALTAITGEASEYNRGIFKIDIPALSGEGGHLRRKMRFIMYVSVDASGSMEETATRPGHATQTKMDFVHMTLTNMIEYIASQEEENPHAEFYIAIVSFDSTVSCALLPCRVTRENKDQLIATVNSIRPRGGTNFQKCFQEIARLMSTEGEYIKPDEHISEEFIQRTHIFLTDGANNEGEKRVQQLATLLTPTLTVPQKPASQIMIGYGPDHDSTMLQSLCAQFPKSKQWFIDDVEKTGCIFGEILWSAANTAYAEVKLSANVEFYDFTSMSWKNEIQIDDLIYDSSRTFYVRVPWRFETVVCEMTYFSTECPSNTSRTTQALVTYVEGADQEAAAPASVTNQSVEQELWRLDTITTVNEALTFLQNIRRMPYNTSVDEKNRLIGVVTAFQEKFLAYVVEKGLSEDPFMIQLADDLFVCISGLMAASIGERYVAARQASQIQQRSVTVNDITPLQTEILFSMPSSSPAAYGDDTSYARDYYPPAAPRRAHSGGGCVDNDTHASAYNTASESPRTPTRVVSVDAHRPDEGEETQETQETQENKENEKLVSDFTPSSRGVGSRLRHLSREAIIGLRGPRGMYHGGGDEGEYYSCGGGAGGGGASEDTFSSHASPGCARIGRMLSAQTQQHSSAPDRTYTAPY